MALCRARFNAISFDAAPILGPCFGGNPETSLLYAISMQIRIITFNMENQRNTFRDNLRRQDVFTARRKAAQYIEDPI